jgi:Rhodopirellula transposase DDE domain
MEIDVDMLRKKHAALKGCLDEARLRIWAAAEARSYERGGVARVAEVTGLSRRTIHRGLKELSEAGSKGPQLDPQRVRVPGAGRKKLTQRDSGLLADLESLVEPLTRGDPGSPLRWTCKSTTQLAGEMNRKRHRVSQRSVCTLLGDLNYSLQSVRKTREGSQHPDRDAQFQHLNRQVAKWLAAGQPVISVDTKKKELIGDFAQKGREWHPQGEPELARAHDFEDLELGKVAPYGVYDLKANQGWVSVGIDHDTAEFAVATIRRWWQEMGHPTYPKARRLLITADGGGSNGYRTRLWKLELQRLASELDMEVSVCHFPPGTSKWNKIEHRMFCHITQNWRGRPLVSRQAVVQLIGNTTTQSGLRVQAALDKRKYAAGVKVSNEEMKSIRLKPEKFHGEWNYTILPQV